VRARGRRLPHGRLGPAALKRSRSALKLVLLAAALAYLALVAWVWLAQERLVFHPPRAVALPRAPQGWRMEPLTLRMRDGTPLDGALLVPPVAHPALVIYFGGNAEDATLEAPEAEREYGPRALLLVNYRGYGRSGGHPGEAAMTADALEIHDWAARRPDIDAARIAVHGRSLGSGVAVALAAQRAVRCLVLTTPFASAVDVGREAFPWLPVSLLMRHRFDSARRAPSMKVPALFLVAEGDEVIPPRHARRLAASWAGPVQEASFAGYGHNDISLAPGYGVAIRAFLDRHL